MSSLDLRVTNENEWASAAADLLTSAEVIGTPTGQTPLPLYAELRRRAARNAADDRDNPAGRRWVMVDDYLGASALPTNSYQWLRRELFDPLVVPDDCILRIPTEFDGPIAVEAACAAYERRLAAWGGCDVLCLGLGGNGHVAFNEPGSSADLRTRVVNLQPETVAANAAYWQGAFHPRQAVTMGIATMLGARRILLLVRGAAKAGILRAAMLGPVTPAVPASLLRASPALTVVADTAAAAQLR